MENGLNARLVEHFIAFFRSELNELKIVQEQECWMSYDIKITLETHFWTL